MSDRRERCQRRGCRVIAVAQRNGTAVCYYHGGGIVELPPAPRCARCHGPLLTVEPPPVEEPTEPMVLRLPRLDEEDDWRVALAERGWPGEPAVVFDLTPTPWSQEDPEAWTTREGMVASWSERTPSSREQQRRSQRRSRLRRRRRRGVLPREQADALRCQRTLARFLARLPLCSPAAHCAQLRVLLALGLVSKRREKRAGKRPRVVYERATMALLAGKP